MVDGGIVRAGCDVLLGIMGLRQIQDWFLFIIHALHGGVPVNSRVTETMHTNMNLAMMPSCALVVSH